MNIYRYEVWGVSPVFGGTAGGRRVSKHLTKLGAKWARHDFAVADKYCKYEVRKVRTF